MTPEPLRLHVCIDQELPDETGSGLVRSWMHFLREACRHPELDVTAHLLGSRESSRSLGPNVRICEHPLVFGSTALLEHVGMRTPVRVGLFPYHRGLARQLRGADVIHTPYTHLSLAMTALLVARRRRVPLVNSLHTHVPSYAEIYAQRFAELVFGRTPLSDPLVKRPRFARALRRAFDVQLRWYLARCNHVLVSAPDPGDSLPPGFPPGRVHYLGRGVDAELFCPEKRDRAWLRHTLGIHEREPVVLFVGKLMAEKNVLALAHVLARLRSEGERFSAVFCGEGEQQPAVAAQLGEKAIFTGVVPHRRLAKIYAAADLFVFPSTTEMYANVVVEAMSSGLPVIISGSAGACQHISRPGEEGAVIDSDQPRVWAEAVAALLRDPERRRRIGLAARERVLKHYGGWGEVFDRTLLPVWLASAEEGARPAGGARATRWPRRDGVRVPAAERLAGCVVTTPPIEETPFRAPLSPPRSR
ncbi:glycosyltransferase [bacterium]|nr:glycosyltransferase [bacterium]